MKTVTLSVESINSVIDSALQAFSGKGKAHTSVLRALICYGKCWLPTAWRL